jgi:hypothetical protein
MGLLAMSRTSLVNFTVNALQLRFAVNACGARLMTPLPDTQSIRSMLNLHLNAHVNAHAILALGIF